MPDQLDPFRRASSFFSFLKACAILGIFSYHCYSDSYLPWFFGITSTEIIERGLLRYFIVTPVLATNPFSAVLQTIFCFGFIGVHLFIIASGFGIYYSYKVKGPTWGIFFKRRLIRLFPLYYLFLLVSFVTYAYFLKYPRYSSPEGLKILFLNIILLQSFDPTNLYGLYYFVGIIVQLYLLFPLLLKTVPIKAMHAPLFLGLCLFSFLVRSVLNLMDIHSGDHLVSDYLPHFFLGMLIAESTMQGGRLYKALFSSVIQIISLTILAGLFYIISYRLPYNSVTGFLIPFAVFFSMPLFFATIRGARFNRLIQWISYGAYVFYLIHIFLLMVVGFLIPSEKIFLLFRDHVSLFRDHVSPTGFVVCYFIGILLIGMAFSIAIQRKYDAILYKFTIAGGKLSKL